MSVGVGAPSDDAFGAPGTGGAAKSNGGCGGRAFLDVPTFATAVGTSCDAEAKSGSTHVGPCDGAGGAFECKSGTSMGEASGGNGMSDHGRAVVWSDTVMGGTSVNGKGNSPLGTGVGGGSCGNTAGTVGEAKGSWQRSCFAPDFRWKMQPVFWQLLVLHPSAQQALPCSTSSMTALGSMWLSSTRSQRGTGQGHFSNFASNAVTRPLKPSAVKSLPERCISRGKAFADGLLRRNQQARSSMESSNKPHLKALRR